MYLLIKFKFRTSDSCLVRDFVRVIMFLYYYYYYYKFDNDIKRNSFKFQA